MKNQVIVQNIQNLTTSGSDKSGRNHSIQEEIG